MFQKIAHLYKQINIQEGIRTTDNREHFAEVNAREKQLLSISSTRFHNDILVCYLHLL